MTAPGTKKESVGIFGGSFNPPHIAHLIIAELIRDQFGLERILWIPNNRSPLKQEHQLAGVEDRLAMTRAATSGNEAFVVSDVEVRRAGVSYTVDTVRMLQECDPEVDYRLIVGSDSLAGLNRWREPEEILERVPLIVFPRIGHAPASAPDGLDDRITFAEAPLLEISGTEIRRRIQAGKSIRYMVVQPVLRYITSRGLYQ